MEESVQSGLGEEEQQLRVVDGREQGQGGLGEEEWLRGEGRGLSVSLLEASLVKTERNTAQPSYCRVFPLHVAEKQVCTHNSFLSFPLYQMFV